HRARQGRHDTRGQLRSCAPERGAAGRHHHRYRSCIPHRRPDRHGDRFQHTRCRAVPRRGDPLARLSDRAEPRDADRRRHRRRELPGRHGLRRSRSAYQIRGLRQTMATIDHKAELARAGAGVSGFWGTSLHLARRYPLGTVGALIVLLFVLTALFAAYLTGYDPTGTSSRSSLARPSADHILGADFMGRDMWSRIVYGARISLAVGIGSTVLGCFFGVFIGLMSGYYGGWLDLLTQLLIDIMQALPLLV